MSKKLIKTITFTLLLLAGIIAVTQETDDFIPGPQSEPALHEDFSSIEISSGEFEMAREIPEWVKPARWFRSNSGGMALEEIQSQFAALRNKYALVIDYIDNEELPEYLSPYYNSDYFIEIRKLYENGEESRTQWIFKDKNGTTRLIAVFVEPETEEITHEEIFDETENDDTDVIVLESMDDDNEEIILENKEKQRNGFIEIFDENSFILSEFRFFDDGGISKTEYNYKDGIIISVHVFTWEENDKESEYIETFVDFYRYNRSSFLRAVERVFYTDRQISTADNSVLISFPNNILDAAKNSYFMGEKLNSYPDFFGYIAAEKDSKIIFTTDERGRILTQTLYDDGEDIVWVIRNIWQDDRIVSIEKEEGDTVLLAQYEYDSDGNRILERNLRNGILERLVRTEDSKDIELLYINNVAVLQAVWEDGRKISETRIVNR